MIYVWIYLVLKIGKDRTVLVSIPIIRHATFKKRAASEATRGWWNYHTV